MTQWIPTPWFRSYNVTLIKTGVLMNIKYQYGFHCIKTIITSNNQRLLECRRQRSKVKTLAIAELCVSFTWQMDRTHVMRLRVLWSNYVLCIPFILSGSSTGMLATYMWRISNNNLEIRIAGSLATCNQYSYSYSYSYYYYYYYYYY